MVELLEWSLQCFMVMSFVVRRSSRHWQFHCRWGARCKSWILIGKRFGWEIWSSWFFFSFLKKMRFSLKIFNETIRRFSKTFSASYLKGDRTSPVISPDVAELHRQSVQSWCLLLSVASDGIVMEEVKLYVWSSGGGGEGGKPELKFCGVFLSNQILSFCFWQLAISRSCPSCWRRRTRTSALPPGKRWRWWTKSFGTCRRSTLRCRNSIGCVCAWESCPRRVPNTRRRRIRSSSGRASVKSCIPLRYVGLILHRNDVWLLLIFLPKALRRIPWFHSSIINRSINQSTNQ